MLAISEYINMTQDSMSKLFQEAIGRNSTKIKLAVDSNGNVT